MIVTASALTRHCGYARRLRRERTPSDNSQVAIDRGVAFHAAVEKMLAERAVPTVADAEMQGWLDLLASQWMPMSGSCEVPWGLSPDGKYVPVREPEPHVYVALDGSPLLTAGRADVIWWEDGVRIGDWKTGKWPTTPAVDNLQINAAGIALAQRFEERSYRPAIYYARDGHWDWAPWVVFGTPAFDRIWSDVRAAALLDETPRPGQWCSGCWERKGCPSAAT